MGAIYTRQSSYTDGDVITAADTNNEFDQLLAAFAASTGHTHDGTTAEGGPITKLLGTSITIGDATSGTDITVTFDGESNDGVLKWMEDEDYFEFSDDILIATTEKIQFRDTAIYINSSADGQLDIVADTEIQIAATTVDINGNVDVSGTLTVAGAVDFGDAALSNIGAVQLDSIAGDGDTDTSITFSGSNVITVANGGTGQVTFNDGSISPVTDSDVDLGTSSLYFKNAYIDSITTTGNLDIEGDIDVNGTTNLDVVDIDGAVDMATTLAVAGNVDFNGDLDVDGTTNLDVVDIDGAVDMASTLAVAGVLTGASLDISGDIDIDGTANLDIVDIDGAVDMATTLAVAGNVDFNGDLDVDGTTNLDVVDIDGAVDMASTLQVDGAITNSSTIVSTGKITADAGIDIDNFNIDGTTIALSSGNMTLDVAGNVTIDADGGTVTFADAGSSLGTITSSGYSGTSAVATTVTITDNENTNENNTVVFVAGADADGGNVGLESDGNLTYNPSTGTLSATNISVSGTLSTVDSVTMSANNAVVFEGATADAHETTLTVVDPTADRTITLPNQSGTVPVLAVASNTAVTSTPEELNVLDGITAVVGELNALDIGSTAVGTAVASKAVILDSNKDYTGIRNLTITGELDAATLDISGAIDVAGTSNLDVVDIDGAVDMASTLQVDGIATFTGIPIAETGLSVKNGSTTAGFVSFFEDSSNGTNSVKLIGPASTADVTLTLPAVTGTIATVAAAIDEATALAIALG